MGLYENTQDGLKLIAGSTLYADMAVGSIIPFGGSVIPTCFLLCDGSAISRTGYSDLFAVIGTTFGIGDGSTTFNLPDLREAVPKGAGLTSKSNSHYDADGVAIGEFVEDRLQEHKHMLSTWEVTSGASGGPDYSANIDDISTTTQYTLNVANARTGVTTEVKAVGVNYIIKAKQIGAPADFLEAADEYIDTKLNDKQSTYAADSTKWDAAPTTGSTKPVTSNGIKTQLDLVHDELSDVNNMLGSKNILPNSATTQVINGITYTVAADGSINANGTATADSILHIIPGTIGKLSAIFSKGGNYIISAGTTGSGVDFFFGLEYTGSTWDIGEWLKYTTYLSKEIYIDGTKLNNSSSYIECYIKVNSGTTVSNIKVYPMLRPAKVKDATYVPYSKTNYELTTEISNLANQSYVFGSAVDLKSYTPSNRYTAPSDGYVRLQNNLSNSGYADIRVTDAASIIFEYAGTLGGYTMRTVFVRKGMEIYVQHCDFNNNWNLSFIPITPV